MKSAQDIEKLVEQKISRDENFNDAMTMVVLTHQTIVSTAHAHGVVLFQRLDASLERAALVMCFWDDDMKPSTYRRAMPEIRASYANISHDFAVRNLFSARIDQVSPILIRERIADGDWLDISAVLGATMLGDGSEPGYYKA